MPSRLDSAIPYTMYPMWLTSVKDSSRLRSLCAIAPRMPTSMVAHAVTRSTRSSAPPGNSNVCARMIE